MNWAAFPYLRIALSFASGIFAYEYYDLSFSTALFPFIAFTILFTIGERYLKVFWPKSAIQGLSLLLLVFFSGGLVIVLKKQDLNINLIECKDRKYITVYGTVTEILKSAKGAKLLVSISGVKDSLNVFNAVDANVILKFSDNDTISLHYTPGDRLLLKTTLIQIPKNTNPEAFDYAYYLKTKSIIQHGFVKIGEHKMSELSPPNKVIQLAGDASRYASGVLSKYIKDPETLGIAEAILLGQKLLLSDDIYKSYTNTGAIHVLSVSGLHVAIFISLFIWLFSLSSRQDIYWKVIKIVSLLTIAWFYVVLTGMSPSVVRAGTMVSLYIVGNNIFKGTNSFNILSIAAIIMLIYNPYYLFQVSFQFSFISLLSILYFQPKISRWWIPKNKVTKFFWDLINVSIAAQILIFPATIFYFHQFPVYFAISGIVAVPMVTLIIYLGTLLVITEGIFAGINVYLGPLLDGLIKVLNYAINVISQWPYSVISDIWISNMSLTFLMISISLFIIWWETRNIKIFYGMLFICGLFLVENIYMTDHFKSKSQITVYDIKGGTLVDYISGGSLYTIKLGNLDSKNIAFTTINNRLKYKVQHIIEPDSISYLVNINNRNVYVNTPFEDPNYVTSNKMDILIVTKNVKNNPETLFKKFHPEIIVLDRSVPTWVEEKWLSLHRTESFKLHNIKTDGAFQYFINDLSL